MDIKALYPAKIDLPYIGEATVRFLTINTIIWAQENDDLPPHEFLSSYLENFAQLSDEEIVKADKLTEAQLDDIASALSQSLQHRITESDPAETVTNTHEFKAYVIKKSVAAEERSKAVMKDVFSKTGIGRLTKIIGHTQSPSQKLIASMDPLGIKAIQQTLNPQWLETMRSAMSISQTVQDHLKLMPDFNDLTVGMTLANNLALPGAEIALLSQQISKQFRVSDLGIGAVMDAHRIGRFSESFLAESLKLPGFNATARAGLVGLASQSASAGILARYADKELNQTAPLGVALKTIKQLDIIEPEDFDALSELAATASQSIGKTQYAHKYNVIQILTLIIAVMSLIVAISDDSGETQKEILSELSAQHQTLTEAFNSDEKTYDNDRILTGTFHLREGGSTETPSIMLLNKGRIVRQQKIQNGWAYVEVLPYGDAESIYGWVYRGGLSKLL